MARRCWSSILKEDPFDGALCDTADTVHGHHQLSLFNAHYDDRT
jgi:hypothetical protein